MNASSLADGSISNLTRREGAPILCAVHPAHGPVDSSMTLVLEEIVDIGALAGLAAEWDALHDRLDPQLPFTTALWNLLWWKHFRADRRSVCDRLHSYAVRDAQGQLIAVAPMMLTQRPAVGPLRTSELQFFGADQNMTEIRGLVCHVEHQAAVVAALGGCFRAKQTRWHWLQWSGLRHQPMMADRDQDGGSLRCTEDIPDYYLPLSSTWEEFRAGLSRNIKESLRKCYNSLKRDGHVFSFHVVERPEEIGAALTRFLELHAARARSKIGTPHNDVFALPNARAFIEEYAQAMAARGQLRIFQIEIAGVVVATRIGLVFDRSLYLYYSGYDVDWARYSIMTTVVAESIKWAIAQGFTTVNLSTGTDISKTRWGPKAHWFSNAVECAPTRYSRLAHQAYVALKDSNRAGAMFAGLMTRFGRDR